MLQMNDLSFQFLAESLRFMFSQRWLLAAIGVATVGISIDISAGVLTILREVRKDTGFESIFEWSAVVVFALRQHGEANTCRYPRLRKLVFLPSVYATGVSLLSIFYVMYALNMGPAAIIVFFYVGAITIILALFTGITVVLPPVFGLTAYVSTVIRAIRKLT